MLQTTPFVSLKINITTRAFRNLISIVAIMLFTGDAGFAQVIASYTGAGGTSTATVGVANETVSVLQTVGFGANTPCGSGGISGLTNNGVFTYSSANAHLFFQILPNPGYAINITGFTAGLRRSNSGIQKVRFAYSLNNGATWIDDLTDHTPNNGGCGTSAVSAWGVGALPTGVTSTTMGVIIALYPYDPIASGGVIQVNTIVIDGTVVAANTPPTFAGGTSLSLVVCENSAATFINSLLAINDPDVGQTETWTVATPPTNGTLGGFSASALSTGGVVTPSGLTYTPNPGFSGTDAFKIQISDGFATNETEVNVTVNATPPAISGVPEVCVGSTTTLSDITAGGTWVSMAPANASIGSLSGVVIGNVAGTSTISYTASTGCSTTTIVTVDPLPSVITGAGSVCVGANTTLTDVAAGGTWVSNDITIATVASGSGLVTGVASGTTLITYVLPTGCMMTTIVTVNALPLAITGNTGLCTGTASPLTDASFGGTWSSSNGAVATIGSNTGVVSGVGFGMSTITFTLPAGCITTTIVTVNSTPPAINGNDNVCVGATSGLTDGGGGGAWSSNNSTIATIGSGSGILAGVAAGTTIITYTTATGCYITTPVTVNTSPSAITGSTSVCTGLTTALSNSVAGGTWSSSDMTIVSVVTGSGAAAGVAIGTATISYVLPGSCVATVVVTVSPTLSGIFGTQSVCAGSMTNLTDAVAGGTWSSSNVMVAAIGSATGTVSGVSGGTVVISYSTGSCASVSAIVTVNALPSPISGTASVCEGFATLLTDATTGGTWSSGNASVATIGTTGIVDGLLAGTSAVSYTLATGCMVNVTVTVNSMPVAISGTQIVCVGSTTTLSDAVTGGAWTSSIPVIASVDAFGNVTGNAAGTTTISYALAGGCHQTASVTVNAAPGIISGPTESCAGFTITLSDPTGGGTWTSSAPTVASVDPTTGVVSALSSGFTFISYAIAGCAPVAHGVNIIPSPAPISGITHVCAGLSTSLSDATPGGAWSSSDPAVPVSASGLVTLTSGGGATITYTLVAGCFTTADVAADSLPAVISGMDTICEGASVVLSDVTHGGIWSSSNGSIALSVALTGEVTGIVSGSVTISYTLITGCYRTMPFYVSPSVPASLAISLSPGDSFLCHNMPLTMTAVPTNGGTPTFVWERFGSYIGTGSTYTYLPTHGDFITCVMTTAGICASPAVVSKDTALNVWPQGGPMTVITTSQPDTTHYVGEVYTFYSTVTFGGPNPQYQWYVNNGPIPGATLPVFTTPLYYENDTIYCRVTGNSPCDTDSYAGNSNTLLIYGQGYLSAGSLSIANSELSLFPNPNAGNFTLSGSLINSTGKEVSFEVNDMLGRTMWSGKATPLNGKLLADIKLGNICAGEYLLRVYTEAGVQSFHFVVDK